VIGDRTDNQLIEEARGGDALAFRSLVERYEDVVAAVVIGMLGPGDEADDVGQETFIRFYRSLDQFRGEASLKTYVSRIAMNLSLNALKRRKRSLDRWAALDDQPEPGDDRTPETGHERRERILAVRRAIAGLSDKHRPVVVLRMVEGYSTRETADILGVPEGTVLSRLARALKRLETVLAPVMVDS
jgi:RNA polymerase sigma-70 factor (ECF subfamily)